MGDRIRVQLIVWEIYLSLTNHPGQLSLSIASWVGAMSTGQRAVMLCDWGVNADMVCLQLTLCDPYLSALEAFAYRRDIQIHVYFTLLHPCISDYSRENFGGHKRVGRAPHPKMNFWLTKSQITNRIL